VDADGPSLRRFARQVVLPEVGEAGQARWRASTVALLGGGDAFVAAAVWLAAAGVGRLRLHGPGASAPSLPTGGSPLPLAAELDARSAGTVEAVADAADAVRQASVVAVAGAALGPPAGAAVPWLAVTARPEGAGAVVGLAAGERADADPPGGPVGRALGAVLADGVLRSLLAGRAVVPSLRLGPEGETAP
jgi:hypothetical protein